MGLNQYNLGTGIVDFEEIRRGAEIEYMGGKGDPGARSYFLGQCR